MKTKIIISVLLMAFLSCEEHNSTENKKDSSSAFEKSSQTIPEPTRITKTDNTPERDIYSDLNEDGIINYVSPNTGESIDATQLTDLELDGFNLIDDFSSLPTKTRSGDASKTLKMGKKKIKNQNKKWFKEFKKSFEKKRKERVARASKVRSKPLPGEEPPPPGGNITVSNYISLGFSYDRTENGFSVYKKVVSNQVPVISGTMAQISEDDYDYVNMPTTTEDFKTEAYINTSSDYLAIIKFYIDGKLISTKNLLNGDDEFIIKKNAYEGLVKYETIN
jgi:hypothetical protein